MMSGHKENERHHGEFYIDIFAKHNKKNFYLLNEIPKRKRNGAMKSYVENDDKILFLYDDTVFGSAKAGFSFGEKGMHWGNGDLSDDFLPYSQFKKGNVFFFEDIPSYILFDKPRCTTLRYGFPILPLADIIDDIIAKNEDSMVEHQATDSKYIFIRLNPDGFHVDKTFTCFYCGNQVIKPKQIVQPGPDLASFEKCKKCQMSYFSEANEKVLVRHDTIFGVTTKLINTGKIDIDKMEYKTVLTEDKIVFVPQFFEKVYGTSSQP